MEKPAASKARGGFLLLVRMTGKLELLSEAHAEELRFDRERT